MVMCFVFLYSLFLSLFFPLPLCGGCGREVGKGRDGVGDVKGRWWLFEILLELKDNLSGLKVQESLEVYLTGADPGGFL